MMNEELDKWAKRLINNANAWQYIEDWVAVLKTDMIRYFNCLIYWLASDILLCIVKGFIAKGHN